MLRRIFSYMKQYKKYAYLALICIAVEAMLELMVPMIMADLIDNGVANGDTHYIYVKGLQMALCALIALVLGIGSARFQSLAGQGLGANIRKAEYEKLQSYSFSNIDHFRVSSYLIYVRQSAMPLNQFTQQVNFLLSALSGAERIFDMMDEEPEVDEGSVTLCNAVKNEDGSLTECKEYTGTFAWKVPANLNTYWNSEAYKDKIKKQIINEVSDMEVTRVNNIVYPADKDNKKGNALADVSDGTYLVELRGDVRFKNVVFGYVPEKTILNDVTLYAKQGQKIAFVGSTGAGKTTIINLINRFYDIQSGSITYDGIDIKDIKKDKKEDVILSNINDIGGADNNTDKKKAGHGKKNKLLYRWIFYIAGLVILALGIMLNTKTNLGVSPIISVPYSISNVIGFNFANMTLIVYVVFVIIEMILHMIWQFVDKSANQLGMYLLRDVLQIPVSIIFTRFLNIFSGMIPSVNNNMPVQIMLLIIAVIMTGIGAAMSLNMRIIPNPGDGIVQAISDTTKLNKRKGKGVGFCKNCFDITNVTITFIIGLSTGHFLLGLGVGTILAMIGVGRVIVVFNNLFMDKMNKIAFDYVE